MNLGEISERLGMRPGRLILLLLSLAILLLGSSLVAPYFLPSCDPQEKVAITEFTHYGGKEAGEDLDIYGDEVNWTPLQEPPPGCALEFAVPRASPEQVLGYYEEKLTEHGWTVKRFPVKREGDFEYPHLEGSRDGFRYVVHSFQLPGSGVTDIRALVYRA
jgi:hypothetical protein